MADQTTKDALAYARALLAAARHLSQILADQTTKDTLAFSRALLAATSHLGQILDAARVGPSHGADHAHAVCLLAMRLAAGRPGVGPRDALAVALAALLHDADDRKYFPNSADYQNARDVLAGLRRLQADLVTPEVEADVVRMISWVSASANHDDVPPEAVAAPHLLYPRHADRLAAVGWTGVLRCWDYTTEAGQPLYLASTERVTTEEELWGRVATPERYAAYRGRSLSMVDHYYDKLLHIGRALLGYEPAVRELARERLAPLLLVVFEFGNTGTLTDGLYQRAQAGAQKEQNAL